MLALFVVVGCAKKPARRPMPTEPPKPMAPMPAPPKEPLTARREASEQMVLSGKQYLAREDFDKAVQTFQEAVNVDPNNGVAYYFLAKALYFAKSYESALGVLDKAKVLLEPYPEWYDEVLQLQLFVEGAIEGAVVKKKEEEEGYY